MDVSKLPKLSDTQREQQAQQQQQQQHQQQPVQSPSADPVSAISSPVPAVRAIGGAEAWISGIVGIICILISKSFPAYWIARLRGQPFHTNVNWTSGPLAGQEVAYPDLSGFTMLSDGAIFIFGVALLCEAALMLAGNANQRVARAMLWLSFVLAAAATLFNAYVAARLFGANILPIMSLLAVAFGGYMASYQWKLLKQTSRLS
jgi:hypothetical protein